MVEALNLFRDVRDDLIERIFHAVYGSPLAQAACSASAPSRRRRWRGRLRTAIVAGLALSLSAQVASSVQCKPHHFRAPYFIKTMGRCGFDQATMSFHGDGVEQTRCLMRGMVPSPEEPRAEEIAARQIPAR